MDLDLSRVADWATSAMWPLGRVVGLVLTAPVLSANAIPGRIRAGFCVVLTIVIAPWLKEQPNVSPMGAAGFALMVQQLLIGAALGFTLKLIFEAMSYGGQLIAMTMGLSYADVVDPQLGISVPVMSQIYAALTTLIFLALDGHLALIQLLADSFTSLPMNQFNFDRDVFWVLASAGSQLFIGALQVALPAASALLIVNLGFGVMSRAAPALNLFAVGFPITLTLGIGAVWLSLRELPSTFISTNSAIFTLLHDLIGATP